MISFSNNLSKTGQPDFSFTKLFVLINFTAVCSDVKLLNNSCICFNSFETVL